MDNLLKLDPNYTACSADHPSIAPEHAARLIRPDLLMEDDVEEANDFGRHLTALAQDRLVIERFKTLMLERGVPLYNTMYCSAHGRETTI
jgi:hypothetical protein